MKNFRLFCRGAALVAICLLAVGAARAELIAYFPFDGNTNEVQNNLPVTVHGGGLTYGTGVFGQAASFDGVDDYLDVADGPGDVLEALDGDSPELWGTIMLWVRTTDTSGSNGSTGSTFVERRVPGSFKVLYKLNLGVDGDLVNLVYPSTKYVDTNTTINDGQWHHIAVTVKRGVGNPDDAYIYAFVDGYQKAAVALDGDDPNYDFTLCEDLHIGAREKNDGSPANFIATEMDELAVYSEYLDGAAIREIMANGVVPEPGVLVLIGFGLATVLMVRRR